MNHVTASEIAQTLDTARDRAKYDAAAKKLVAQKSVLAYIIKSALNEFADNPVQKIAEEFIEGLPQVGEAAVHQDHSDTFLSERETAKLSGSARIEGMPTEDISVREGTVRYDIRFQARIPGDGGQITVIINIEIQNRDTPGYPIPKRGIYYGSRLISAQRGTVFKNQEYDRIRKVVSIWVCQDAALERSDSINEYLFTEDCRQGAYREPKENYDLMRIVVMRLGSRGEQSKDDAIRLLSKLFSTEMTAEEKKSVLSEEFHIKVTEEMNQEVNLMCNLSTGIYDKGKNEGALEMLFSLVKNNLLSIPVAARQADMEQAAFEKKYKSYIK